MTTGYKFLQKVRRNGGYTIDQTILIVAIIAILVTMVILTVGWNIINKASGTKLASQFKQIEDASGQFYAQHRTWPHRAYTAPAATAALNIAALANHTAITAWAPNIVATQRRNLISGIQVSAAGQATHSFANTGNITMQANTAVAWGLNAANIYYIVQFADIPISEARNADEGIDNTADATADVGAATGRLVYGTSTCQNATVNGAAPAPAAPAAGTNTVFVCYAANLIQ
jgi:hypothetical protein